MQVFRGVSACPPGPIALTIGNFDGLHLGHQAMLARLIAAARARKLPAAVMTFEPHPREFFAPDSAPARLTNLREKLEGLREIGVDQVYICRFNRAFSRISADDFVIRVLHQQLAVRWLLVGNDFRFGAGRVGDYPLLSRYASQSGIELCAMAPVEVDGKRVSSTLIRGALAAGDMALAENYLGRPYGMHGKVVQGERIGRTLGFPTANVQMKHGRPPLRGIFAVKLHMPDGRVMTGVASLGTRPTVTEAGELKLEVHVFDFAGDLYGKPVQVVFLHKLRDEAHYPDLQTLTAQISRDAAAARRYFETSAND